MQRFIELAGLVTTDNELKPVGLLHLIEHSFKTSTFKRDLFLKCAGDRNDSSILVIDIVSEWKSLLRNYDVGVHVMSSTSILNIDGLISFLLQLNESPREALKRCQRRDSLSKQLSGIVIDNVSYIVHDPGSYNLLLRTLKMLRNTFGCWIITISYGLEFYNGVENSTASLYRSGSITRVPISYTNEMDAMIIRDTDSSARLCS